MSTSMDAHREARSSDHGSRGLAIERRRAKPVKWWATLGAACLVLQAYVYAAWILSGNATPTDPGPDPIPTWMLWLIYVQQVVLPLGMLHGVTVFLYKPWRRDGQIGFDGTLWLCMLGVFWMQPMVNYTQPVATFNAHFVNFGSWAANIPGWISPNGNRFAEPLLWSVPIYVYALFGGMVGANELMRRTSARWPELGTAGMIAICAAILIVGDTIFEMFFIALGVFSYPGAVRSLSFFPDTRFQYPIYESILWGGTLTGFACVRYFRNEKGETFVERGLDRIEGSPRAKGLLRGLALLGIYSVIFMAYNVSASWFSLHADAWPDDIQARSYLSNHICGPRTEYACPGPAVPMAKVGSAHLNPRGELVPSADSRPR